MASIDLGDAGGADSVGEGEDFLVGLVIKVETADQGFYFLIRECRGDLTDNIVGAAVGAAVEDHKAVRSVEDETLLMGKVVWSPTTLFLQIHVFTDAFFLQSRRLVRNQVNALAWGKVPGDEFDPVCIFLQNSFRHSDIFLIIPDSLITVLLACVAQVEWSGLVGTKKYAHSVRMVKMRMGENTEVHIFDAQPKHISILQKSPDAPASRSIFFPLYSIKIDNPHSQPRFSAGMLSESTVAFIDEIPFIKR